MQLATIITSLHFRHILFLEIEFYLLTKVLFYMVIVKELQVYYSYLPKLKGCLQRHLPSGTLCMCLIKTKSDSVNHIAPSVQTHQSC